MALLEDLRLVIELDEPLERRQQRTGRHVHARLASKFEIPAAFTDPVGHAQASCDIWMMRKRGDELGHRFGRACAGNPRKLCRDECGDVGKPSAGRIDESHPVAIEPCSRGTPLANFDLQLVGQYSHEGGAFDPRERLDSLPGGADVEEEQ